MADVTIAEDRPRFDRKAYMAEYRKRKAAEISAQRKEYHARNAGRFDEANRERTRKWCAEHPERHRENMARLYASDPQRGKQRTLKSKARRRAIDPAAYKAKQAAYMRRRREEVKKRISDRMANRLWYALKHKGGKKGTWLAYVDYSVDQLRDHLATTMPTGFTWDDFMSGALHIDHAKPIASFDYASTDDAAFKACWALSNLQLLPAVENLKKNSRLDWPAAA